MGWSKNTTQGIMALMPRKHNKTKSVPRRNVPLDVDEHPIAVGTAFNQALETSSDVITDEQPIVQLDKHGQPIKSDAAHLADYKWKPGQSGNPQGRPKDVIKEIGKRIASAKVDKILSPKSRQLAQDMGFDPRDMTLLESIMLQLASSKNPMKIELFLKRTFGNVPNVNINAEVDAQLVARFRAKFTDSELESIADGASPMDILFEKLPDIDTNDYSNIIEAEVDE